MPMQETVVGIKYQSSKDSGNLQTRRQHGSPGGTIGGISFFITHKSIVAQLFAWFVLEPPAHQIPVQDGAKKAGKPREIKVSSLFYVHFSPMWPVAIPGYAGAQMGAYP